MKPDLTVCVVSYNHEKYIAQCLESLLEQDVNFSYRIIVSDDCSTDSTWPIICEFSRKYPNIIYAHRHEKNVGPFKNYVFAHHLTEAKYIAHMDGDDYALQGKLQMQFDILEKNKNCNVVLHAVEILQSDGTLRPSRRINKDFPHEYFTQADQINLTWIGAHSSKMYRRSVEPIYANNEKCIDFFLIFQEIGSGICIFVGDRSYGVYREGIGLATKGNLTRNLLIEHLAFIYTKFPEFRDYVCSAFIYMVISDIKNRSDTLKLTFAWLRRTIKLKGILVFLKTLRKRMKIIL